MLSTTPTLKVIIYYIIPITKRNYDVLKQPVITKVAGERSKKAQSRELLKSVAVTVSPKLKKIARYNKTDNRKIRERIGERRGPIGLG